MIRQSKSGSIVNAIQEWLELNERSAAYLARKAGMDVHYICSILSSSRHPGPRILKKLERAMGLEPGALVDLLSREASETHHTPDNGDAEYFPAESNYHHEEVADAQTT